MSIKVERMLVCDNMREDYEEYEEINKDDSVRIVLEDDTYYYGEIFSITNDAISIDVEDVGIKNIKINNIKFIESI